MRARIAVLGDTNQDFIMRAEAMPRPGETRVATDLQFAAGGKGANQAVAAARTGSQVQLISAVGDDPFGTQLLDSIKREGIITDCVLRGEGVPSGMAFIALAPDGQNSILHARGAADLITPATVEDAADAIEQAQWLLVNLGVAREAVLRAMQIANDAGTRVLFDPAPVCEGLAEMWPLTDICTPNELETERIMGIMPDAPESAAQAGEWFRARGVRAAIITLGADGCVIVDDDGARVVKSFEVEAVDTTACGDAFAGALATRLGEGASLDEATLFAGAAGALAATVLGAQPSLPRRSAVEQLMTEQ
jgi:ribokinase